MSTRSLPKVTAAAAYMTMAEATQYLRVSESTLKRAVYSGALAAKKVGGYYRFRTADLDAWFDALPEA